MFNSPRKRPKGFQNKNIKICEKKLIEEKALELYNLSKYDKAENLYKDLIDDGHVSSSILNNLAIILSKKGETQNVIKLLKKSIKIDSKNSKTFNNLGVAFNNLNDTKNAKLYLSTAIKLNPFHPDPYNNIGYSYALESNVDSAIKYFRKATELKPDFHNAFLNLANAYLEKNNFVEAKRFILKSLEIKPDYKKAYINLAKINHDLNDLDTALDNFQNILKFENNDEEIYNDIGVIYGKKSFLEKASIFFDKALEINKNYELAYINYSQLHIEKGNYAEAVRLFDIAFEINKNIDIFTKRASAKRYICDWNKFNEDTKYIEKNKHLIKSIDPRTIMFLSDDPQLSLDISKRHFDKNFSRIEENIVYKSKSKIRIGYFSADFNNHPVTFLIAKVLKEHDRDDFEIFAYSFGQKSDDQYTQKIKNNVDHFKNLNDLNDMQAVEMVRKDSIDIAIDLMGYTSHCRTSIFAIRLAPIQINYLGFTGSMGCNCIDYIIADNTLIPFSEQELYTEKILYLNQSAICCDDSLRKDAIKINRSKYNLPENNFLFACFNSNYKITPKEFHIWMNLIREVKNSKIVLVPSNKNAHLNLIKEVQMREIDLERIIFAEKLPVEKHLERHTTIDLFLDTFNFNAGCTAVFSLLSGVPIITKYGRSYQSRMSSSLLKNLGLDELIAYDEKEYEEKALFFARNPEKLKSVKIKLSKSLDKNKTLNSNYFTRELEEKFKKLIANKKQFNN